MPLIEIFEETVEEEDPMEGEEPTELATEPAPEAAFESGVGWIVDSDESSHKWM